MAKHTTASLHDRVPFAIRRPAEDGRQLGVAAHAQGPTLSALVPQAVREHLAPPVAERDATSGER